jgi:uncharacterized protein YndB with AHSA1/START domain
VSDDQIQIHEHFDCSQQELWDAITDGAQLSAWFGGTCTIDAREGGNIRFDIPADGVVASGVVRAFKPPQAGMAVAHLEHTFVDNNRPDFTSVCAWAVVKRNDDSPSTEPGCDLYFTMDGVGEVGTSSLVDVWPTESAATSADDARAALASAQSVLLVDWIGPATPRTIARLAPVTYGKIGPAEDDWALVEPSDEGDGFRATRGPKPQHADLLHLDWTLGFDEFVAVAVELGVKTFWYHSGRTRPPAPADNRGVWVPSRQSARQRATVEALGMTYIDDHYILDVAATIEGRQ